MNLAANTAIENRKIFDIEKLNSQITAAHDKAKRN